MLLVLYIFLFSKTISQRMAVRGTVNSWWMATLEMKGAANAASSGQAVPPEPSPHCSIRQSHTGTDFKQTSFLIQDLIALAGAFLQTHKVTLLKSARCTRSFLPTSGFQTKCKWNNIEQNTNVSHFCEKPQGTKFSLLLAKRVSNPLQWMVQLLNGILILLWN